ncbi:TonB-dependent receptor [uncultured Campylobacter sp.]|uniref:TonB-dependent receptor n=1 Tax=uncultured Campylobacter sp. TaxID=218934 RepID=UPI002616D241|nr:TonB-dependent receptor [uncultured Campylobacter sp.]
MRKILLSSSLIFMLFSAQGAFGEEERLADSDRFGPLKSFGPPKFIAPPSAQKQTLENQFDRADRNYYSAADAIDEAISSLRLKSGFYGRNFYNSALTNFRTSKFYGIFNLNHTKANGYKDGLGREVDFGYERFAQAAILGFVPSEYAEFRLTYMHDDIADDKQPEYQMDPVDTDRHIVRFDGRLGLEELSNTVRFGARYRNIKREANNYKLRNSPQNMQIKLNRKIWDYYLKYDADLGSWHNQIGASYERDEHLGRRFRINGNQSILNAYRFADLNIDRFKIFDTLSYEFSSEHKLTAALAYEKDIAKAKKADLTLENPLNPATLFPSANMLWQNFYGRQVDGTLKEDAYSAELKYDFTPQNQLYGVRIAHIERIGDNVEKFNSLGNFVYNRAQNRLISQRPGSSIVGNPFLKKEEHNLVKLEAKFKDGADYMKSAFGGDLDAGAFVSYDDVKNLIIFDRARAQYGIYANSGDIIARNVDAKIIQTSAYAKFNVTQNFGIAAKAYYTYGQNDTDGRALYQIRPFELNLNVDYKDYFAYGSWNVGAAARAVSKHTRGDFDAANGLGIDDKDAAKGFMTLDLYSGVNIRDKFGVKFGVNNVFDKKYAEFISADHIEAFAPISTINAPGRTFWLSFHAAF